MAEQVLNSAKLCVADETILRLSTSVAPASSETSKASESKLVLVNGTNANCENAVVAEVHKRNETVKSSEHDSFLSSKPDKFVVGENMERINYLLQASRKLALDDAEKNLSDARESFMFLKDSKASTKRKGEISITTRKHECNLSSSTLHFPDKVGASKYIVQCAGNSIVTNANMNRNSNFSNIGSNSSWLAMAIGRKCLIKMAPCLKRLFCKGCGSAILPTINARCRTKNKGRKKKRPTHLVITCSLCHAIKRVPINSDYELRLDFEKRESFGQSSENGD